MSDSIVRLDFPARADYLLLARLALAGLARTVPLGEELLADLKLAVTEACGNSVRHAYNGDPGTVRLWFIVGADRLEMIVEDEGVGVEHLPELESTTWPDELMRPGTREPAGLEGGMGMAIIRTVVDELRVDPGKDGRGTIVRMTKYLFAAR